MAGYHEAVDRGWPEAALKRELREFEVKVPMTPAERAELGEWVRRGNSVHCNWCWHHENGGEMNFLDALRFENDMRGQMMRMDGKMAEEM